ncbi:MAG: DUF1987 domain-containing protein [Bacteroidales bacterium]
MENIEITRSPAKPYFPSIDFNFKKGVCEIVGESYMEEAYKFYIPLINWIKEFTEKENRKLTLNIKLIYFNTSTTKCLLDIFELMKKYHNNGNEMEINWFYDKDDPDMVEEVKDFEKEADVSINIIEF